MVIKRFIASKTELKDIIQQLLHDEFKIEKTLSLQLYDRLLKRHMDQLIDNSYFFIEAPYVDKVYRDSFYSYYSSKLGSYKRDCIRISIFDKVISDSDFRDSASISTLQTSYLGFMVLRPTLPFILGRSIISPKALKLKNLLTNYAKFHATANSVKFEVEGFPHSSQDTETITCAETSVWAIMEYFGYKYAEYKPVLPSQITESLKNLSSERQIPSKGLRIDHMAFALRKFGFGTKIYSSNEFANGDFKRIFSTYVESGIPLIIAIRNTHLRANPPNTVAHAALCIGHKETEYQEIDTLKTTYEDDSIKPLVTAKNIQFFDNDDIEREYVFVDDNMPAYQLNKFETPTTHYPASEWHNCEITHFIVPLYPKVYLEAYQAKHVIKQILLRKFSIPQNSEIFLRFYLTSSRSFKYHLTVDPLISNDIKDLMIEISLPKFIWVAEISDKTLIKTRIANGIILIDATEAQIENMQPLLFGIYRDELLYFDENQNKIIVKVVSLQSFSIFTNNLKGF